MWVSAFAMFLLITALPWTTVWGAGLKEVREFASPPVKQDWSQSRADEHTEHQRAAGAAAVATPLTLDQIVARVAPLELEPPVRVYLPDERMPFWRVRAETQNRPLVRELELDANTGAVLNDKGFDGKPMLDRVIGVGIAAHEGQLFGIGNQLLGLATALGLIDDVRFRGGDVVAAETRGRARRACCARRGVHDSSATHGAHRVPRNSSAHAWRLTAGALGHYAIGGARRRLGAFHFNMDCA